MDSQLPDAATKKNWLPFRSFYLASPLPRAECVARLIAATRDNGPLVGSVSDDNFRVGWRPNSSGIVRMRNSFRPHLFGKLEDADGGTLLRCHFTLDPVVLGIVSVVLPVGVGAAVVSNFWTFLVGLLFLVMFGTAAAWDDREFILNQLQMTISARARP